MTPRGRACRLMVLAVIASGWAPAPASAQPAGQGSVTTPTSAVMTAGVAVGDVMYVTDTTGATIKGELAALTDDAMQVKVRADLREIAAADVRRIEWQRPDSFLTGVVIGAAVGAIPGIYYLAVDPNECSGMCPGEYALIVIGAVVGGVIDHAIKTTVTVYSAEPASGRAGSVTIAPVVMRDRKGVQVAVKF
jgi:hypothetical protein